MKIGLYFGSFNPIHVGHLVIANHMANYAGFDQVWLVVSPHNPHKKKNSLLEGYHRLTLVKLAIEGNDKLRACDIEFKLPIPSYTVVTLAKLKEDYPKNEFSLLMGEDNMRTFHKWYNYEEILANYKLYVYPRIDSNLSDGSSSELLNHEQVEFCQDVPVMKISSSFIRKAIKEGKDVRYLLTDPVLNYVDEMNFYK